jgi:hypothetical protein
MVKLVSFKNKKAGPVLLDHTVLSNWQKTAMSSLLWMTFQTQILVVALITFFCKINNYSTVYLVIAKRKFQFKNVS